jgi:hypothetical protein
LEILRIPKRTIIDIGNLTKIIEKNPRNRLWPRTWMDQIMKVLR